MKRASWVAAAVLLLAPAPAGAQEAPRSFNLAGTSVRAVLDYLSYIEKKPVVLPPLFPVEKKVNIVSGRGVDVSPEKMRALIESLFKSMGFLLVDRGTFLEVLPAEKAKDLAEGVVRQLPAPAPGKDRMLTYVFTVRRADPAKLVTFVEHLKSAAGQIKAYAEARRIVATDYESVLRDVGQIIDDIDSTWAERAHRVIALKYASATEASGVLSKSFGAGGDRVAASELSITSYEATNSLVLSGAEETVQRAVQLVDVLDRPAPQGSSGYCVYRLLHCNAEDVAKTMTQVLAGRKSKGVASGGREEPVVVADKLSNSVIVWAPPGAVPEYVELLKKLDRDRPRVLIEAAFVELTSDRLRDLGVELATVDAAGTGVTTFGASGTGLTTVDLNNMTRSVSSSAPTSGLFLGLFKDEAGRIPILIAMSEKDTGVSLLAAPRITVNDGQEAQIKIADSIPYDRSVIGPNGTVTSVTFEGYLEAGIELKITPYVNEDGSVRMKVLHKVESFQSTSFSETRPAKNTRMADTEVTVLQGQTLVIAGLSRDEETVTEWRVPFLADIPYLGLLFQRKQTNLVKRHLCAFISPRILHDAAEEAAAKRDRQEELRRELREKGARALGREMGKDTEPRPPSKDKPDETAPGQAPPAPEQQHDPAH